MKRIILSIMVLAFAVAVQAGDAKTGQDKDKDAPTCCTGKVKVSNQAKEGSCPFAKAACCKQAPVKQTVLLSPKAAGDAKQ
jgi:hypothetical protein